MKPQLSVLLFPFGLSSFSAMGVVDALSMLLPNCWSLVVPSSSSSPGVEGSPFREGKRFFSFHELNLLELDLRVILSL
jgi:hypothetical protein